MHLEINTLKTFNTRAEFQKLSQKITDCEQRLAVLEDRSAIGQLMTRYGLAADCGNDAVAMRCHTENAQYRVCAPKAGREGEHDDLVLEGREAIGAMLRSDLHQNMLPNTAHTVGPNAIEVDGDTAQAVGYSRLYLKEGEQPRLMRLSINQWGFEKVSGQWLIASRTSRLVGEQAAQEILLSLV